MAIHPAAWVVWLAATVFALSATRNPWYLATVLGCIAGVSLALRRSSAPSPLPLALLRFGVLIVITSALLNVVTAHVGQTVLFTVPAALPLFGGPYTLEALIYGALNGLVLVGFLGAFAVLYRALPTHALIRLIPRAFYPMAVVVSIAVAYVPTTLTQFQQIREAQMMRGHRVRGLRDWLPLFMPLLVGGLERALQLAEAMTARGFGSVGARSTPEGSRLLSMSLARPLLVLGLLLVLAGLLSQWFWRQVAAGTVLWATGGLLVLTVLWLEGRRVQRTNYHRQPWTGRDWAVAAGAALFPAMLLLPAVSTASLAYTPYPRASWPPCELTVVVALLGLLAPALVLIRAAGAEDRSHSYVS